LKRNKKHRFILVLDGLDNLDGKDNNQDLIWLPSQFPSNNNKNKQTNKHKERTNKHKEKIKRNEMIRDFKENEF